MSQDKWFISDEYREASIAILIENLAPLRAKLGITQEEIAGILGISRQTYYSMETGKREMSWGLYLALMFFFDSVKETSEMIRDLKIYPIDLVMKFNEKAPELLDKV